MLAGIGELEPRFRKSGQQQLLLETLMVRFALLDRSVAIEDVLRGLGDDGSASGGSRPSRQSLGSTSGRASAGGGVGAGDPPRRAASDSGGGAADRPVNPPVMRDQSSRPRSDTPWRPPAGPTATASRGPQAVAVAPPPPRATSAGGAGLPSINLITERWDEVVAALSSSRMLLAPFLEQATPSAISSTGSLTVQAEDEAAADALEMAKTDMLAVVKGIFPAVERVVIARPSGPSVSGSHKRVTEEEIRQQRITSLRKRDPVLGAAIDALDLELLD
jgi:DNA polymerase-3 subunit gamma/tau